MWRFANLRSRLFGVSRTYDQHRTRIFGVLSSRCVVVLKFDFYMRTAYMVRTFYREGANLYAFRGNVRRNSRYIANLAKAGPRTAHWAHIYPYPRRFPQVGGPRLLRSQLRWFTSRRGNTYP